MGVYIMQAAVQFNDVDAQNRLTTKGMLRLMQEAANCHSSQVGYGMNNIEETGYSWVLHQQHCRMYQRPGWNTQLTIRTWSRGAEGLICLRDFEVLDESGERVAIASTAWLLIDARSLRMLKVPEGMMDEYGTVTDSVFGQPLKRLKALPEAEKTWEYTILKRDIDINRHVNNLCYLDFALESLPAQVDEAELNDVNIMYKKAAYLGDPIACFGGWETGVEAEKDLGDPACMPYVVAIKDPTGQHLHAVIRLEKK